MRISSSHEYIANLLADSDVDLNSQKAICEFLANLSAPAPTHGMNARIWDRAKVLRKQRARAPMISGSQFIAEMNTHTRRLISAATNFPDVPEDPPQVICGPLDLEKRS
jgi:hypothetical protein